jgi:glycosyltransferase involved in cell wall biosynthesis
MPCYNEEGTLAIALQALPRQVPGVDQVEWLIINDGSTDRTIEVARENGVDHIVDLGSHQGLARAFIAGTRRSAARRGGYHREYRCG